MGDLGLDGITVTPLKQIATEGGAVLHAMKDSDSGYVGFGEAYFSWICSGAIKGWKRHNKMIMNLVVPVGSVRFVFHDARNGTNDAFRILAIGEENYARITVPSGLWFAFQGISENDSLILNISQIQHDSAETDRKALSKFNFDWKAIS